jgi:hypothetical protein
MGWKDAPLANVPAAAPKWQSAPLASAAAPAVVSPRPAADPYLADLPVPGTGPGYEPPKAPDTSWQEPGAIVPIQFQNGTGNARLAVPGIISDAWDAVQAPGKAARGGYDEVAIDPSTGDVDPFDPRMVSDAQNLASMVTPATPGARAAVAVPKAPNTVESLKADAGALYKAADESGVTFDGPRVSALVNDVTAKVMSEGIDPTLHPRATAALKRLNEVSATGMTVKEVQTMRRILAAAGKDVMNPDEGRIAGMMVTALDDMTAGAAPELAQARGLYSQAKKGELIESTIQKARDDSTVNYSASGFEQALRRNFKNLMTNKAAMRGFSTEEKEAIRKVAEGGPIENFMRYVGKWSAGGPVSATTSFAGPMAAVTGLTGDATIGALAGMATLGIGGAARAGATRSTLNNARLAASAALDGTPSRGSIQTPFLEGLIPKAETGLIEQNFGQSPLQTLATTPRFRLSV